MFTRNFPFVEPVYIGLGIGAYAAYGITNRCPAALDTARREAIATARKGRKAKVTIMAGLEPSSVEKVASKDVQSEICT